MIYHELMDIFYGENKFVFYVNGNNYRRSFSRGRKRDCGNPFTLAFGGEASAARWMKECGIIISLPYTIQLESDLRRHMNGFATAFTDTQFPCRLRKLTVSFPEYLRQYHGSRYYMLEPLARLRGLESVTINTPDDAFSRKLESVMMGRQMDLQVLEYGVQLYKRKKRGGGKNVMRRTLKRYYEPEFDWSWELENPGLLATRTDHSAHGEKLNQTAVVEGTGYGIPLGKFLMDYGILLRR
jgi:hypothetical protein